jgi:hypothetical protein
VVELCELDLKLALGALRPLRKDIQNEARSIDDAAREGFLEVALLRTRKRVIENDELGAARGFALGDFGDFAASGEERSVGPVATTSNFRYDLRACRRGERLDFGHSIAVIGSAERERDDQRAVSTARPFKHRATSAAASRFAAYAMAIRARRRCELEAIRDQLSASAP